MHTLRNNKGTIIGLIILALIIVVAYVFRDSTGPFARTYLGGADQPLNLQVVNKLNFYKNLEGVDKYNFNNAVLKSLNDMTPVLKPEYIGRSNPFSPIGVETGVSSSTLSTTTRANRR